MAKPKSHKRQHYVPASYLKAWRDPQCRAGMEPYIWVFDKDGTNGRRKAPSNIFTETDMYTITGPDGTRDLRIERGLSELEGKFCKIRVSKFSYQRTLSDDERVYLAAFVAAAQVRTPAMRDHHAEQWQNIANKMDRMQERIDAASPSERAKMATTGGLDDKRSISHDQVKQMAAAPLQMIIGTVLRTIPRILCRMELTIFVTDNPIGFVTSDVPCVWFDPEAYKLPPLYRGVGLACKTIEVTMPVSPSQCLMFTWSVGMEGYRVASEETVVELNRRHRAHCNEQYIVRTNARDDRWFIEPPMPPDAWENQRKPKVGSVEAT